MYVEEELQSVWADIAYGSPLWDGWFGTWA